MTTVERPLVIRDLAFLGGMAAAGGWRPSDDLPEIAFVGRSNVGKSSLLNRLVGRRAFARVSATPGRTREINFFRVNSAFLLVDLPGYGYARVARDQRHQWRPLIEAYLNGTRQLRGVVALFDARREPSRPDLDLLDFLAELEVPVLAVITKVDKLGKVQREQALDGIVRAIGLDPVQVVACSARTGEGRDELAAAIERLLGEPAWRAA